MFVIWDNVRCDIKIQFLRERRPNAILDFGWGCDETLSFTFSVLGDYLAVTESRGLYLSIKSFDELMFMLFYVW